MPTFAELLTEYASRTGIGDAELARRIPVSRLTLVRWKEGVTERPRYREDVLRPVDGSWQIARRTIVLDSNVILAKNLSVFF